MIPTIDEPEEVVKDTAFYLRRIRNWTIGLGVLGFIAIAYYNMAQGVYAEQDAIAIVEREAAYQAKQNDRLYTKEQVDRIVNAISNQSPTIIIIVQKPQHHRRHHHESTKTENH